MKTLTNNELEAMVDLLTCIYQEAKTDDNEATVEYVKQILDLIDPPTV